MIYTVTFNPALDYVVFLDNLKLGDVNRSTRESIFYGGKGINVSTILNTGSTGYPHRFHSSARGQFQNQCKSKTWR